MKELLKKLILADSTPDRGELETANVIVGFFDSHGLDCRIDTWDKTRANLVLRIKSTGERPGLLFASHLDVVPAGDCGRWSNPPFEPVESDGRIFGRGAADMKGPIAALCAAIIDVAESGWQLKGDIIFAATAGEETDSCGAKKFISENGDDLPDLAGVVINEPTNFDIVTAHRGMFWIKVKTFGKAAHGSMPQLGINAIEKMSVLLDRLSDFRFDVAEHPPLGGCSMSVNEIGGGKATNMVPDECFINIDIRTLPGQSHQDIMDKFNSIFNELSRADKEFKAELSVIRSVEALHTASDSDFVKSINQITGIYNSCAVGFTTDGPFFAALDVPVIIFGPGHSGICHQYNEYIDIEDLQKARRYYTDMIKGFLA